MRNVAVLNHQRRGRSTHIDTDLLMWAVNRRERFGNQIQRDWQPCCHLVSVLLNVEKVLHFFVLRPLFSPKKDNEDSGKIGKWTLRVLTLLLLPREETQRQKQIQRQRQRPDEKDQREKSSASFILLPLTNSSLPPDKISTKQEVFYCYMLLLFDYVIKLSFFSSLCVVFVFRLTEQTIGRCLLSRGVADTSLFFSSPHLTRQLKLLSVVVVVVLFLKLFSLL